MECFMILVKDINKNVNLYQLQMKRKDIINKYNNLIK